MSQLTKINLGCGPLPLSPQDLKYMGGNIDDWILADKYPENSDVMELDMEDLSRFPDNHFTDMYSSHSLEHIPHQKIPQLLKHWYSKLASGGTLIINVPDLMYAFKQLKAMENEQVPDGLYNQLTGKLSPLTIIYGSQEQDGEWHYGGFTSGLLTHLLVMAGFTVLYVQTVYEDHKMDCLIAHATK